MSSLEVNDILDQLLAENKRLLNELVLTKKCFKVLSEVRVFIELLFTKYKIKFEQKDVNYYYQTLAKEVADVLDKDLKPVNEVSEDDSEHEEAIAHNVKSEVKNEIKSDNSSVDNSDDGLDCDDTTDGEDYDPKAEKLKRSLPRSSQQKRAKKLKAKACPKTTRRRVKRKEPASDRPFKCDFESCQKSFGSQMGLSLHKSTHTQYYIDKREIQCSHEWCKKRFISEVAMKCHLCLDHSDSDEFVCDWQDCEYRSQKRDAFRAHYMTHWTVRYRCEWPGCDRHFNSRTWLESHMAGHRGDRSFACQWPGCDYGTYTKLLLRQHMVTHSNDYRFECVWPDCGQRFKRKHHLDSHTLNRHSDGQTPKRFRCQECSFQTNRQRDLFRHLVVHSDARPFVCKVKDCGKAFKTESILGSHMKTHSTERNYKCFYDGCDKAFKWNRHLKEHITEKHSTEPKPRFECDWPQCQYKNKRKCNLDKHYLRAHGIDISKEPQS